MAIGNKLFALADKEFRKNRATPTTTTKFRGMKLNIGKYDEQWDRKRGAAVRMMSVILRDDDEALLRRVTTNGGAGKTYQDAATWFRREADYLRRVAGMLEKAADRLAVVLERRQETSST